MVNGTYRYDLVMSTPLGKRHGSLELVFTDSGAEVTIPEAVKGTLKK